MSLTRVLKEANRLQRLEQQYKHLEQELITTKAQYEKLEIKNYILETEVNFYRDLLKVTSNQDQDSSSSEEVVSSEVNPAKKQRTTCPLDSILD